MNFVGDITRYIDVAQLVLYAFWIFFAGLVYYLHRENKREGYPLDSDRSAAAPRVKVQGFPAMPGPKTYLLAHGGTVTTPDTSPPQPRDLRAVPVAGFPGAPLEPTGDPMLDGVGPASWTQRDDVPDLTTDGRPRIVPLRVASTHTIAAGGHDPRGLPVLGGDGAVAGVVRDVWVDRSEEIVRYYEVELSAGGNLRRVLLPSTFAKIAGSPRRVEVRAILARQFANVPALANADQVTRLEEDRIVGYYGGGTLYAEPGRLGPVF